MADAIAASFATRVFPPCPHCQGTNVKLLIKGYPSQDLLAYAFSPQSRVALSDTSQPGTYNYFDCKVNF